MIGCDCLKKHEENPPTEIISGLILGGIMSLEEMIRMQPDILVPLDYLPGEIWNMGFRGEILYCPIKDYSILPDDVLDWLVLQICERLQNGRRAALFCIGGHGRTGYVASCVLFQMGIPEPIPYLRTHYSRYVVETDEQELAVERFCHTHGSM